MKQKTILCCSKALFVGAVIAFIFCVLMAVFTAQIGNSETMNILFGAVFSQAQKLAGEELPPKIEEQNPMVLVGGIMIAITVVGIIFACCTKITMHCICVTLTMIVLFILSIILMVFGALLVGPRVAGKTYITDNCNYASSGQLDQVDAYSRQIFEPIIDFDKQFQEGVNKKMCTDFCVCPGTVTDTHYKEYEKVPISTYHKFERSFQPDAKYPNYKSLVWSYMPGFDQNPTSESMMQCYDNALKISEQMAKLHGDPDSYERQRQEIEKAKPDPTFIKIVSHIEEKYKCSGLCEKPLFYFTQSVKNGPPKSPCLEPLVSDITLLLQNLGGVLLITGILFLFMFICAIPICYYNKEKEATENDEEEQGQKEQDGKDRSEKYKQDENQQANQMA